VRNVDIPFVSAKFFGGPLKRVELIVMHSAETGERLDSAEAVARWFANPRKANGGWAVCSAHYAVDANSVVCSVPETTIAWHARGVNDRSIGIEFAGSAAQAREQWLDDYGLSMLVMGHGLVCDIAVRHGLPISFVDAAGILKGIKGVTTHREVTKAYKIRGGHTDPGVNFPIEVVLSGRV